MIIDKPVKIHGMNHRSQCVVWLRSWQPGYHH